MRFIEIQFQKFLEWKITETELRESLAHMSSGEHTVIVSKLIGGGGQWYITYDKDIICLDSREYHHRT